MIISTAEETRLFLPNHVLENIEPWLGFFDNSEHDFLAERIGAPLLAKLNEWYEPLMTPDQDENIPAVALAQTPEHKRATMEKLLLHCQRCVVFDAISRAADIHAISLNDAGLNVAESRNYESAADKRIESYKSQLYKEAHAAANRLLIQLENWQKEVALEAEAIKAAEEKGETLEVKDADKVEIVTLWKQSDYYYYWDDLLFCTATEFGKFVDIYDSREKFIRILPDIRYCQETFIEAEIGTDLLYNLINKAKEGCLNDVEKITINKLRRVLSLQVEARSKIIGRKEAKDEAAGNTKLLLQYMASHQKHYDKEAVQSAPFFDVNLWADPTAPAVPEPPMPEEQKPFLYGDPRLAHRKRGDGMLVSSII